MALTMAGWLAVRDDPAYVYGWVKSIFDIYSIGHAFERALLL
jgi:hypothetical protein